MVDNGDNTYGGKYVINPRYSTYQCDSTIACIECNGCEYISSPAWPVNSYM